jgi:leucyl aminopeptidase
MEFLLARAGADATTRAAGDTLALACHPGPLLAGGVAAEPYRSLAERVLPGARVAGFTGDPGRTMLVPPTRPEDPVVLLVGVGEVDESGEPTDDELRRVGAALVVDCPSAGRVVTTVGAVRPAAAAAGIGAVVEGALLAAYRYRDDRVPGPDRIEFVPGPGADVEAAATAIAVAQARATATNLARDLINDPPNLMRPEDLAAAAVKAVAGTDIAVEIVDDAALRDAGFGAIAAVGAGSAHPPCLVIMRYDPPGATGRVTLVGKGITYDSGGLCLKSKEWLPLMKADMAGAAVVIATMSALPALSVTTAVTAYLPLAENMPSGAALRAGDVVTVHNGTTVEVVNTDAEGRLVLADVLSLAATEPTDAIVDVATLCSGAVDALGSGFAAVLSNRPWLADEVAAAARAAGERTWPLPLPEDYRERLRSPVAGLRNYAGNAGDPIIAGLFLGEFAGDRPWLHLDVIGPSWQLAGPGSAGATGFGVRSLLGWLESRSTLRPAPGKDPP